MTADRSAGDSRVAQGERSPLFASLPNVAIAAGLTASLLFIVIGLTYRLQEYGDGSIFSYAVAVQDAWAFHWHNISGRVFVYLFSFLPAEAFIALTGEARGGINVYGLMFFSAPLLGLALAYVTDRSAGRIIFGYGCASTACLCPLVFSAPTEMWVAHALFWPALARCHYAPANPIGFLTAFALLLALVLTHEGALVLAFTILVTVLFRGWRDAAFVRTGTALVLALVLWGLVKLLLPPDAYFASILPWAEFNFINYRNLEAYLLRVLLAALAGYAILTLALSRVMARCACLVAAVIVTAALAIFWLWFDRWLHTEDRYYLRTALLLATPAAGALAALFALRAEDRLHIPVPLLPRLLDALAGRAMARTAIGAMALVLLVHTVETAKFVNAWTHYKAAVRALATGTQSDPALGDPRFVSSQRIAPALQRLAWPSTTPFLSVLLAPQFDPTRLVVDPQQDYFWIDCRTATMNEQAPRAVPVKGRKLIRVHTCLHR